jgi:molecular chaperone GrpE
MSDPTLSEQASTPEPAPVPEAPKSLEDLLAEAQARIEEQRNAHLRALADAENARKRAQADIAAAGKYAIERLVSDLLPVIDSLEAALAAEPSDAGALRSGVELTLRQLRSAFEKARVAEINPAPKEKFDPNRHQAMAAVEADAEPNTVVAVMQKGYLLHDRVVRPALVTVAKAVEKPATNPISDAGLASNQGH